MSDRMVTPDTTEPSGPRPVGRGRMVVAAAVLVAAGAIIAGQTEPSVPGPNDTTGTTDTTIALITPTTTVAFVTQGDPLQFETMDLDGFPLALLETETGEIVLAQGEVQPEGITAVRIYSSRDGLSWRHLSDPIGPPNRFYGASVTDLGLVVYGQDGSGNPTLWISEDGRSWTTSTIDSGGDWRVYGVGATEDLVLAHGFSSAWTRLDTVVRERFGETGLRYQTLHEGDNEPRILLHSPLGLPLEEFTMAELGMDPAEFEEPDKDEVRATTDGVEWYEATLPHTGYIAGLFEGHDGELWTVRQEDFTTRLFSTTDGLTWRERGDAGASAAHILPWREGLVSISPDMRIRTSADGVEWATVTLRDLFTAPHEWYVQPLSASDAGIAVLAQRLLRGPEQFDPEETTIVFEREGRVVRITPSLVTVFDSDRQTVLVNVARWSSVPTGSVSFDEDGRTVTIHRGPGGEPLVTFTVDELAELETESHLLAANRQQDSQTVLMTSRDGCAWTTQELVLPDPTWHVYSGVLVGDRLALSVDTLSEPGMAAQLWWASLPEPNHTCPPE